MLDFFDLPVEYNGNEKLFPAELQPMGFTHKIKVTVEGIEILFEPDEERNYRAVNYDSGKSISIDLGLLQAICKTLDDLFGNGNQSNITA